MREGGGDCLKYLQKGGTEKWGAETKILKRGQAESRKGCLRKGRAGTPLQAMLGLFFSLLIVVKIMLPTKFHFKHLRKRSL